MELASHLPRCNRRSGLPDVLMDERSHLLEGLLPNLRGNIVQKPFALTFEDGFFDLAASFAVLADELFTIWSRMRRLVAAC